jgi:hypothetical protein
MEGGLEDKAQRLLRAVHELAEGDPDALVNGREAAQRAGLEFGSREYEETGKRLNDEGLLTHQDVRYGLLRMTPDGARQAEEG